MYNNLYDIVHVFLGDLPSAYLFIEPIAVLILLIVIIWVALVLPWKIIFKGV